MDELAIHRDKILSDSYDKVPISNKEAIQKEEVLQPFIENGTVPLEIPSYKKEAYMYALVKKTHLEKQKTYETRVEVKSYNTVVEAKSQKDKNRFAAYDGVYLLNNPNAELEAKVAKAKAAKKTSDK